MCHFFSCVLVCYIILHTTVHTNAQDAAVFSECIGLPNSTTLTILLQQLVDINTNSNHETIVAIQYGPYYTCQVNGTTMELFQELSVILGYIDLNGSDSIILAQFELKCIDAGSGNVTDNFWIYSNITVLNNTSKFYATLGLLTNCTYCSVFADNDHHCLIIAPSYSTPTSVITTPSDISTDTISSTITTSSINMSVLNYSTPTSVITTPSTISTDTISSTITTSSINMSVLNYSTPTSVITTPSTISTDTISSTITTSSINMSVLNYSTPTSQQLTPSSLITPINAHFSTSTDYINNDNVVSTPALISCVVGTGVIVLIILIINIIPMFLFRSKAKNQEIHCSTRIVAKGTELPVSIDYNTNSDKDQQTVISYKVSVANQI